MPSRISPGARRWRRCARRNSIMTTLVDELGQRLQGDAGRIAAMSLTPSLEQVGRVTRIGDGVAHVSGLAQARMDELLRFEGGVQALVVELGEDSIGCVMLDSQHAVPAGSLVIGRASCRDRVGTSV